MEDKITFEDAIGTLTGFDEDIIEDRFKVSIMEAERKPVKLMRGVIYILESRKDPKYKVNDAKNMPFRDVTEYFAEDDPIKVETDEGKADDSE